MYCSFLVFHYIVAGFYVSAARSGPYIC